MTAPTTQDTPDTATVVVGIYHDLRRSKSMAHKIHLSQSIFSIT